MILRYLCLGLMLVLVAGCPSPRVLSDAVAPPPEDGSQSSSSADAGEGEGSRTYRGDLGGDLDPESLEGMAGNATDKASEALLSQRSIYFTVDSDTITPDYHAVIEAHAAYLLSAEKTQLVLEGHADERGTREYNLALGERRAQSVKRLMSLLGVAPSQIRVVSYGEEHPYANGHNEESWSLNRRVDLVY